MLGPHRWFKLCHWAFIDILEEAGMMSLSLLCYHLTYTHFSKWRGRHEGMGQTLGMATGGCHLACERSPTATTGNATSATHNQISVQGP